MTSHAEELQRLRDEAATHVGEADPAILTGFGSPSSGEALSGQISVISSPQQPTQDWQIIDHRSLSPCGSSPRSFAPPDIGLQGEQTTGSDEPEVQLSPEASLGIASDDPPLPSSSQELDQLIQALLLDSGVGPILSSQLPSAAPGVPISDVQQVVVSQESTEAKEAVPDFGQESPELLRSANSSFVDLSPPSASTSTSETPDPRAPSLTEEQGSDGLVVLDDFDDQLDGSHFSATSEVPVEYADEEEIPDTGVCSIVTGYPVDYPVDTSFEHLSSGSPFSQSHVEFARRSLESSRPSISSQRSSSGQSAVRPPPTQSESYWSRYIRAAGSTQAARTLKRMWGALQQYAGRLGAVIPPKLKARMQSLLQFLDSATRSTGADKGRSRFMISAFVVLSVLLTFTCMENRCLAKSLRAREAELQHHILTILDLNAKLTNAVDIPIARHCAYKTSLSLTSTIF